MSEELNHHHILYCFLYLFNILVVNQPLKTVQMWLYFQVLLWICSIWYVWYCRSHIHCFWIWLWRVIQRTRETLTKNDIVWRYDLAFVWYVNKIPFLMLWNYNKDTSKTLLWLVMHVWHLCLNMCSIFFYNAPTK